MGDGLIWNDFQNCRKLAKTTELCMQICGQFAGTEIALTIPDILTSNKPRLRAVSFGIISSICIDINFFKLSGWANIY